MSWLLDLLKALFGKSSATQAPAPAPPASTPEPAPTKEKVYMITMKELNPKGFKLTPDQESNANFLLEAMNEVRSEYGKPMIVTSGIRDMADHLRIYAEKGITDPKKVPMGSSHLQGLAVDISDPDGKLRDWVLQNLDLMQKLGLYFEDFRWTKGWVHFQRKAPGSGRRIFCPYADTKTYPMTNPSAWSGQYDSKYDKAA